MTGTDRETAGHRSFEDAPPHVVEFYKENHREQTFAVARAKAARFRGLGERKMSAWDALLELDAALAVEDARVAAARYLVFCANMKTPVFTFLLSKKVKELGYEEFGPTEQQAIRQS